MSRKKAEEVFSWDAVQDFLRQRNVTLRSAGLDDVPMAYKDIDAVTAAQSGLVAPLARFEPRLVWLDPSAFKQVEHAALRVARDGVDSEVGQQMGVTSSYFIRAFEVPHVGQGRKIRNGRVTFLPRRNTHTGKRI